jgi:ubiquinol-cytochrome c reductase cytochrome b subunit/cytochrome b6
MHIPNNQKDKGEDKSLTARKGAYHFFPDHFTSELSVFLCLVLIICLLALAFPARMGPPSDPMVTPEHIKPEWYFLPFYHMLKLVPGSVGVTIIGMLGLVILLWPTLDHYHFQQIDKLFKDRIEVSIVFGIVVVGIYLALVFVEAGS